MSDTISLGIDLGTTNSVVAWSDHSTTKVLPLTQLVKAGLVGEQAQLPSQLLIPFEGQFQEASLSLPWSPASPYITGQMAKEAASTNPDRVVTSAKSWLCNPQIDRKAPLLPWKSEISEPKVSPYEASKQYLQHMRNAVQHYFGQPIQQVTLTVPASFDEVARNLTFQAAEEAGFREPTLLEEPLAALYAWLERSQDSWREQIAPGDTILVCDLGGGTADFSLILAAEDEGSLSLERISVGRHLLLGGDNMDLALAYQLKAKFEAEGNSVDHWQFQSLIRQAQLAKEKLLTEEAPESVPVTIAGRGSSLFDSTLQTHAVFQEAKTLIIEGFFPIVERDAVPQEGTGAGLQELGLEFESEPAFTRHLAAFLRRSADQVGQSEMLLPTAILFNGGVCKSELIRQRILDLMQHWGASPKVLEGNNLDVAVSEGAAYFGRMRQSGEGIRIRAGSPRSYYIGLESSMPAVPGLKPEVKGVCVVPMGMEEGSEVTLESQEFSVLAGRPVEFRFFSGEDQNAHGEIVSHADERLTETSRLQMTLESEETQRIPVRLQSRLTDVGTLELWLLSQIDDRRFKLEFDTRAEKKTS